MDGTFAPMGHKFVTVAPMMDRVIQNDLDQRDRRKLSDTVEIDDLSSSSPVVFSSRSIAGPNITVPGKDIRRRAHRVGCRFQIVREHACGRCIEV